ncbi:MAG: hypothetical protein OXQ29_05975 [Rhodospirillaceae bacterium]|nr:hypothetical protein [Rhodospirillaceae bacterium]
MHIVDDQVGIVVANDLFEGEVFVDRFHDIPYCDARARDPRLIGMNSRIDGDSVHLMPPSIYPVTS